jgi:serralysin
MPYRFWGLLDSCLAANDVISGNGGDDLIYGDAGNDILDGIDYSIPYLTRSIVHGGTGNDWINGGGKVYGDTGDDQISGYQLEAHGGDGNDYINGSTNPNGQAFGENGNDRFSNCKNANGGSGDDVFTAYIDLFDTSIFTGGAGKDTMVINDPEELHVEFKDFKSIDDTIELNHIAGLSGLKPGQLSASNFLVAGTRQMDANDFIIFNPGDDTVYYDADGSGRGYFAEPLVTIGVSSTINASDFIVS